MDIQADIELLPNGIVLSFVGGKPEQPIIDVISWQYIDLSGSDVDVQHYDDDVAFIHRGFCVLGIPVPVTKDKADIIRATTFPRGKEVEVFDPTGDGVEFFILSDSGSRRVAANVRHRYVIAKRLGCEPVVTSGSVVWRGRHTFAVRVD
jgi:hypothetical protein